MSKSVPFLLKYCIILHFDGDYSFYITLNKEPNICYIVEKMDKLIWTNKLSIGNTKIDEEHKKLMGIHNDLIEFDPVLDGRGKLAMLLSKMADYSIDHFKKEEDYMHKMDYPGLAEHKGYHKDYIYKVSIYNSNLLAAKPPDVSDIIHFLNRWWVDHIMHIDRKYEEYRKQIHSELAY